MRNWLDSLAGRLAKICTTSFVMLLAGAATYAQDTSGGTGGEANLKLPDLSQVHFIGGVDGHKLLLWGILFCILGLAFGLTIYSSLKNLPVHSSMREISELIYETCKTYLVTQGKFLMLALEFSSPPSSCSTSACCSHTKRCAVVVIFLFSVLGIARQLRRGLVRHPRQHLRQLAHGVCRPCAASRIRSTRFLSMPA